MSSPSAGPGLPRSCPFCPSACNLHIPKHRVIDDELQHQLLFCDAEVAGVPLGPFLLLLLLPLVISQAGGGGDINRHR